MNLRTKLIIILILSLALAYLLTHTLRAEASSTSRPQIPEAGQSADLAPVLPSPQPSVPPSIEEITSHIRQVFGKQADNAIAVSRCESGLRYDATNRNTNGTGDFGLFQINDVHVRTFGDEFKRSWTENVRVAKALFNSSGWQPWYSSGKCHKLSKYLWVPLYPMYA